MLFEGIAGRYISWLQYGRPDPVTDQTIETAHKVFRLLKQELKNCSVFDINERSIQLIRESMLKRGNSINYVEKVLIYLRSFLKYCKKVEKIEVMSPDEVELPKRKKTIPDYYTNEQLLQIFKAIDQTSFQGMRTAALIITILSTGMRISEVVSIKRDIDRNRGLAKIVGKGNKEGIVFFHSWCLNTLDQYLSMRDDKEPWMFIANYYKSRHGQLTPDCARKYLQELSLIVGFQINPHKLRRTAATCFQHNGGDIFDIQQFLRHSRITTTQNYIGINYVRIQKAHDKFLTYGEQIERFFTPGGSKLLGST